MPGVNLVLSGLEETVKRLRSMPAKLGKKVVRKAMRKGCKVIQKQAKINAPVDTGLLKKKISVRSAKAKKRGDIAMRVQTGTREQMGIPADAKAYYPAVQEYGSQKRNIPGKHYMKQAYEAKGDEAKKVATDEIIAGLDEAAKS